MALGSKAPVSVWEWRTQVGNDALVSIRRGDVDDVSFSFVTVEDAWSQESGESVPTRTLMKVRLLDVSPVAFPATRRRMWPCAHWGHGGWNKNPPDPLVSSCECHGKGWPKRKRNIGSLFVKEAFGDLIRVSARLLATGYGHR